MKAKLSYGAMNGVVRVGSLTLNDTIEISGGESFMRKADEHFQDGNDQDARAAVRMALQAALRKLDAVHGTVGTAQAESVFSGPDLEMETA